MSDTLLYRAAFVWDSISHYKYSFTIGFFLKSGLLEYQALELSRMKKEGKREKKKNR